MSYIKFMRNMSQTEHCYSAMLKNSIFKENLWLIILAHVSANC
ncbi:hypothetical protein CRENPOLYSF2_1750007 [Crenothrix polyspora]|uniref:Uncharacterized protein n=1 Tax=Crenothrix polyspora TaxID=360316 RepID=A0A1R4H335_9GAMM|nr:hypothetical protein CRENPOLYSF2_1750007 [Crenothrix polyspora]